MMYHLVVMKSFLQFVRGDVIRDATIVADVLAGEHKGFVTKITVPNTSEG